MFKFTKDTWFNNIKGDCLSGVVVALALIPEAIAFSIIAGLDLKLVYTPRFQYVSLLRSQAQGPE